VEKNLILTEQDYRYLFSNASDAIWVHDMDGNIQVANNACEKLTGYSRQELIGTNVTKFLTAKSMETAREVRRKLDEGKIMEPYEQRILRKDGTVAIAMMATSPVIIKNKIWGFQHIARDVTEEKQSQENMRYYVQQITRAQEDERKRLARELHDEMSPYLVILLRRIDEITSKPKMSKPLKEELAKIRKQAVEALESVRRCAQDLRPRILDDLGLIPALEWMVEKIEKNYHIGTRVEVAGREPTLPSEVQVLLFRIAQEALSNIRKHSQATKALVKLDFESKLVRMTVSDDGTGFELPEQYESLASNGKLGIMGMYERAKLLGGTLKIQSEPGKGTLVITEVPLPD
jgi:PAS domain S-box-containing protein